MASGITNRGKKNLLGTRYRGATVPTNFYLFLATSASTPTADTNTKSDLTEIATGNGYTAGGYELTPGGTDFDVFTEDDANDRALVQLKDITWTASGGSIPSSGNGARWAILTDDNATPANRDVDAWFDLSSDRSVSDGQTLTLQNCELRISAPA